MADADFTAFAIAAQSGGQDYDEYEFEDHFSADLGGADSLGIIIVNGCIRIETSGGNQVEISVDERVRATDYSEAQWIAEEVKLVSSYEGSRLQIELDYGEAREMIRNSNRNYCGSLIVRVPAHIELHLETTNGDVEVPRTEAAVYVETTNGSIDLQSCRGEADLHTTNGRITVGRVDGSIEAETTNGRVEATIDGPLSGDVNLDTTNGAINLAIDPSCDFRVEADTSNGRVNCELPGIDGHYNRRHTHFEGVNGGGGHFINLDTTNGSITIKSN